MNKKIFLTSILAIGFAMPAMADSITNQSSCTTGVLGQSDNNSTANIEATWTLNNIVCDAGAYLNKTTGECDTCPENEYCPGGTYNVEMSNTGNNACSTVGDGTYTLTDGDGYSSANDCYKEYTQACTSWTCPTGATCTQDTTISTDGWWYYGASDGDAGHPMCTMQTMTCPTGYTAKYGLSKVINTDGEHRYAKGVSGGNDYCFVDGSGSSGNCSNENTTALNRNEWKVTWADGTVVTGHGLCSSTNGVWANTGTPDTTGTGDTKYCWCQSTGFSTTAEGSVGASSSWVFSNDYGSASDCANYCANNCAGDVQFNRVFRGALFGSLGAYGPSCAANVINIDWDPQNGEAHTTNQCTYDGAITLPAEPSKTGYTFGGWRLKTNN